MDRKLLQYLVEYLVEEGKAHGCALPPCRIASRYPGSGAAALPADGDAQRKAAAFVMQ